MKPNGRFWIYLCFLGLGIGLQACGRYPERYHIEDLGGFTLPESFSQEEFIESSTLNFLKGHMDPADAVLLVKNAFGFEKAKRPTKEWLGVQLYEEVPDVYEKHREDKERIGYFQVNVRTGHFEGTVTFRFAGSGGEQPDFF
ncbi:MAG: hypothetical protein IPN95_08065 [Bacteroidetes bacterium]|nr:hypothetical protein [Bacteroidota bacterium]MBL0019641.1 hypothetical protein [Bacteroidota bacterium]MBP6721719.1 hypothetical protein [Bacteroidia bacterium]